MTPLLLAAVLAGQIDYPIVYLRGDRSPTKRFATPEVSPTFQSEPGVDLVLRHPDGSEEVLIDAGDSGSVLDPYPSLDAKSIYYAYCPNVTDTARKIPVAGCDVYRLDLESRESTQLTTQAWSRNASHPTHDAKFGVLNMNPCPLPGGRVAFVSTRYGLISNGGNRNAVPQLFVMDDDGRNVEAIAPMSLGAALHPTLLHDGKLAFSTMEGQGWRNTASAGSLWGVWVIDPDGRNWGPLFSAFARADAMHWQGQTTDHDIYTTAYYHQNNGGFGQVIGAPYPIKGFNAGPHNDVTVRSGVRRIKNGEPGYRTLGFAFSPSGLFTQTPWAHDGERSEINPDPSRPLPGGYAGKVSHPSAAPGNKLLITWAQGDDGGGEEATYKLVIAELGSNQVAEHPLDMTIVTESDDYHRYQPKALVAYADMFGEDPPELPWIPDSTRYPDLLPPGTPYGIVGSSSVYARESRGEVGDRKHWGLVGSDSEAPWNNGDIDKIRFLAMEPTADTYSKTTVIRDFRAFGEERLRILGEIPVHKNAPLDPEGNPDTSFAARIPADVPYTFQLIDKQGRVLSMAQTWHQVRPGESRTDCRGCHAHHSPGPFFADTFAATSGYEVQTLEGNKSYEWYEDVLPILQAKCFECHGPESDDPPNGFVITDDLGSDRDRIMPYRSRESLLVQYVMGEAGTIMPPVGNDPLDDNEKQALIRWVDTGAGRDLHPGDPTKNGVKADDLRPTLNVIPRSREPQPIDRILIGVHDYESGVDLDSLFVELDGDVISDHFAYDPSEHVFKSMLPEPMTKGRLVVEIRDNAGNVTHCDRVFDAGGIIDPTPEPEPSEEAKAVMEVIDSLLEQVEKLRKLLEGM